MNEVTIDLSDLLHKLGRKWKWIVCCAVVFAVAANWFGTQKAMHSWETAKANHEAFAAAAAELPWYYTEEMYLLRSELTDEAAALAESYARVYRSFLNRYGEENSQPGDDTQLEGYMAFLDSLKDVYSVMGGAQREYFQHLISIDTTKEGLPRTPVGEFEEERPTAIQGKWIIIGLLLGTAGSSAALTMPYLMTKRLRNSKDLPAAFGVPILAEGRNADAGALASGLSILAEKFGMKSMILLGYDGGAAKKMMLKMKENWPKESSTELMTVDCFQTAELPEKMAKSDAAVLVEEMGKSRYTSIEKEVELCRAYGIRLLGCIILD